MGGEALYTGHGIFSDQRHADPLFGGGVGCVNFPRTQREIAHQTGPPKFCGNSGAGRETYSLNRGTDFTHAPARLSATNGAQTRDAFYLGHRDVTNREHGDSGNAGCGYHVPGEEGRPPDLNRSFYVSGRELPEEFQLPGIRSYVAKGEPTKSGRGPTISKTSPTLGSRQEDFRPASLAYFPPRDHNPKTIVQSDVSPLHSVLEVVSNQITESNRQNQQMLAAMMESQRQFMSTMLSGQQQKTYQNHHSRII